MLSILAATIQCIVVVSIAVNEYNRRSVAVFLWAMILVIFSLPHFASVILDNTSYTDSTMLLASIFVVGFSAIYEISRHIHIRERYPRVLRPPMDINRVGILVSPAEKIALGIFIILCLGMVVFSSHAVGQTGGSSWGAIYQAQRNAGISVATFAPYLFPAFCGAIVVAILDKHWALSLCLFGTTLIYLLISRNRIIGMTVVIPVLFLIISRHKRMTGYQAIQYAILAAIIVFCVYGLLVFRHAGTFQNFARTYEVSSFIKEVISNIFSDDGEFGLRNIFYYFIEHGNNFNGFNEGATYVRTLLFWLPSSISAGIKPDDFAITMASAYLGMPNNSTYSVHPTFFGDAFANFNFFGVFLGSLWAGIFNILDVWLGRMGSHKKIYCICAIGFCLIVIGRGSIYNGLIMLIISLTIISLLDLLNLFHSEAKSERHAKFELRL